MKEEKKSRYFHLITWIQDRLGASPKIRDSGRIARLKRADNPALACQAWDILFTLGVREKDFLPCCTVAAAMCRLGSEKDGDASLGLALASCFEKDADKELGGRRLRRLLACSSVEELCAVLRPVFAYISAKARRKVCFAQLLDEIIAFGVPERQEQIKLRWARDFWKIAQPED